MAIGPTGADSLSTLASDHPSQPGKEDKCPVCGMLVHRYPDFIASVTYKDRSMVFFDGVKDLVKYLFNLSAYAPKRHREDIQQIHVTEYYDMKTLSAHAAFFVVGSDILGPMGHELIPFQSAEDAQQFLKDHKGRRILRLNEITPALIRQLD